MPWKTYSMRIIIVVVVVVVNGGSRGGSVQWRYEKKKMFNLPNGGTKTLIRII